MSFWKKFVSREGNRANRRTRRKSRQVSRLETLERRQLMAADLGLSVEMPLPETPEGAQRVEIVEVASMEPHAAHGTTVLAWARVDGVVPGSELPQSATTLAPATDPVDAASRATSQNNLKQIGVAAHNSLEDFGNLTVEGESQAILIGLLLPAVQKVREASVEMPGDLASDTSPLDNRLESGDDVIVDGKIITAENPSIDVGFPDFVIDAMGDDPTATTTANKASPMLMLSCASGTH